MPNRRANCRTLSLHHRDHYWALASRRRLDEPGDAPLPAERPRVPRARRRGQHISPAGRRRSQRSTPLHPPRSPRLAVAYAPPLKQKAQQQGSKRGAVERRCSLDALRRQTARRPGREALSRQPRPYAGQSAASRAFLRNLSDPVKRVKSRGFLELSRQQQCGSQLLLPGTGIPCKRRQSGPNASALSRTSACRATAGRHEPPSRAAGTCSETRATRNQGPNLAAAATPHR